MFRFSFLALLVSGFTGTMIHAQDVANPVRETSFATVGRPPAPTILGGRIHEYKLDHWDRHPCCGYGKTHDDMGVQGTRGTLIQYWGGSCEFFGENCRRPTLQAAQGRPNAAQRMYNEMFGSSQGGCASCGK